MKPSTGEAFYKNTFVKGLTEVIHFVFQNKAQSLPACDHSLFSLPELTRMSFSYFLSIYVLISKSQNNIVLI